MRQGVRAANKPENRELSQPFAARRFPAQATPCKGCAAASCNTPDEQKVAASTGRRGGVAEKVRVDPEVHQPHGEAAHCEAGPACVVQDSKFGASFSGWQQQLVFQIGAPAHAPAPPTKTRGAATSPAISSSAAPSAPSISPTAVKRSGKAVQELRSGSEVRQWMNRARQ